MKLYDSSDFGLAIRNRRKELHYTQSTLTGFSISYISDLERGKPTAELEKAIHLANILGMDIIAEKRG